MDQGARALAQREFRLPLVLEAGAGTGKTTTLVARVLAWSLGVGWDRAEARLYSAMKKRNQPGTPEPDRVAARVLGGVVAITFTEAAASDMARKVGEALSAVERGDPPQGLLEEVLPADLEVRARRAGALLGALDHLVVRTIHAFCRRLLASYPLEAGLHPRFQVDADGEALKDLVREVVEGELRASYDGEGEPTHLWLVAQGVGPAEIAAALETLCNAGLPASALAEDPLADGPVSVLIARLQTHAERVRDLLAEARDEKGFGRAKLVGNLFDALTRLCASLEQMAMGRLDDVIALVAREIPGNLVDRLAAWGRGQLKGKDEEERLGPLLHDLGPPSAALRRLARHLEQLEPRLLDAGRRVLHPLMVTLERQLRSRGVETFSALLRDARDLLTGRADVAELVRGDIDQLLVDEFQDTDRVQCEIIRALALQGPDSRRPGLFLVGDPKQSIYGWRSADLSAYEAFVDEVIAAGGQKSPLVVNFRSAPVILEEVTRVHERVMHYERGVQPEFKALVPSERTKNNPGFDQAPWAPVEYWLSWTLDESRSAPAGKTNADDAGAREARALARDLIALRLQGVRWMDMAILLRSTTHLDQVLEALREGNIPYAVERDKNYYRRREIIDAAAVVRSVLDPNDHLALLTLLRSPSVGVPDAALMPLWMERLPGLMSELHGPDADRLEEIAAVVHRAAARVPEVPGLDRVSGWQHSLIAALAQIARLRDDLEHEPADVWVERLRGAFLVEISEAARYQGHYRLANLERFFRALTAALERDGGDPQLLLRSLRASVAEAREAEEGRPKETAGDAVQVMTIHKSKGLDFGHVYLLQMHAKTGQNSGRRGTTAAVSGPDPAAPRGEGERWEYRIFGAPTLGYDLVEASAEVVSAAEMVRTLYVAMTRAKDRLVIAGSLPRVAPAEADRIVSHADLLAARGLPELVPALATLAAGRRDDRATIDGASWVFLGLQPDDIPRWAPSGVAEIALASHGRVAADAAKLQIGRVAAAEREQRPHGAMASAEAHEGLRASVAERRFSEERAGDDALAGEGGRVMDLKERVRLAVGSAIHRVLETLDLDAPLPAELARQRRRLPGYLRTLVGADDLRAAEITATALLDRLVDGPLLDRLRALSRHILARELPVLLGPEAAGPEGPKPVGFVSGVVDLLYRDPESGELVVVDYKADSAPADPASLAALAEAFAPQGRVYVDAVESALGERPRLELWFLQLGVIWRADPALLRPEAR